MTFTTSHCRTRATELPLRANYNLRGHRSEASFISLSLSLTRVFTFPLPRFHAISASKRDARGEASESSHFSLFILFPDPLKRLITLIFLIPVENDDKCERFLFKFVKKVSKAKKYLEVFSAPHQSLNEPCRFGPCLSAFEFFRTRGRPNCRIIVVISAWVVSRKHGQFLLNEYGSIVHRMKIESSSYRSFSPFLVGSRDNQFFFSLSLSSFFLIICVYTHIYKTAYPLVLTAQSN